jgi:hypothetical protein
MTSKKNSLCSAWFYLIYASSTQKQFIAKPTTPMHRKSNLIFINKSKFIDAISKNYPEEIELFRAMAIEQRFNSIQKLRKSS